MNTEQKFFLGDGIIVLCWIFFGALFHFLSGNIIVLFLGVCGMLFMSHYFHRVTMKPLYESIGYSRWQLALLERLERSIPKKSKTK